MSQVRVLRYAMELYALKLLPITPARTSGMLQIWCRGLVWSPNLQVGGFVWSSTIHINVKKIQMHHPLRHSQLILT